MTEAGAQAALWVDKDLRLKSLVSVWEQKWHMRRRGESLVGRCLKHSVGHETSSNELIGAH